MHGLKGFNHISTPAMLDHEVVYVVTVKVLTGQSYGVLYAYEI
jgi:hypothetical protein